MNPHRPTPRLVSLLIILLLLVGSALVVKPVSAADSIVVSNLNDSGDGSLRQAIAGISPNGIITFDPNLSGQTITLSSTLNIQKNMVIDAGDLDQPVTISGDEKARVFYVNQNVTNAELNHLTISHGKNLEIPYSNSGGGIFNVGYLTLINCTLSDNQTDWTGGAIYNEGTLNVENSRFYHNQSKYSGGAIANYGTMIISNSIFSDNHSTDLHGGGIANFADLDISASSFLDNSANAYGGGLYNTNDGDLTLISSTLSGNRTVSDSYTLGGGIYNQGNVQIINSTLSENIVEGELVFGGGIYNYASGSLILTNSTLSGNIAKGTQAFGGGIFNYGSMKFTNTIIANSFGGNCHNNGTIHSDSTHNMVKLSNCNVMTNLAGDPLLGPLADNGGPTLTHALLPGSPAIDAGSGTNCPEIDQRGIPRPQGATCDIGAFEVEQIPVTNNANEGDGSLRQAITDIPPGGIITFNTGLSGQTITLSSSLVIEKHLMIDGSSLLVPISLSGNNAVGVLMIGPLGEVTLDSIKIIHGNRENGGGIYNMGVLTIMNSTIAGNHAYTNGGGIFNMGFLEAVNSTLSGNNASFKGGGVFNNGTLVVAQSRFYANNADLGGAIRNDEGAQSNITVTNSTFLENEASHGGAIDNWGDGPNLINTTSLIENSASASGGAIRNWSALTVENSIVSRNSVSDYDGVGGGIRNEGTLVLENLVIHGNTARYVGGGISNEGTLMLLNVVLNGNEAGSGGGIYNLGNVQITNSTLFGNWAIFDGGGILNVATLNLTNSTLSGNTAKRGGGILNDGSLNLLHVTLFENMADQGQGGGIINYPGKTMKFINTIVADSTGGDCVNNDGTIDSESTHNLVTDGSCHITSNLSGDPMLGPLADNGGPTLTHALLPDSPAIDAGSDTPCPEFDQRGVTRPQGAVCDIGAFEFDPARDGVSKIFLPLILH